MLQNIYTMYPPTLLLTRHVSYVVAISRVRDDERAGRSKALANGAFRVHNGSHFLRRPKNPEVPI